ncbi:MAG TPA: hypothetical protein VEX11_03090 [Acetobacteraceae bacterium]|jgi:hypothetical protein|nr:hypothetical protein [Acetobacteraceae bacterium]
MSWKIVGTAAAAALALVACDTGSDRGTSAAVARSSTGMSSASPTVGGTPMVGGPVNQSATTIAPSQPPMATAPMSAAERRRMARDERRGGSVSERDRAYMGGGMVQSSGSAAAMGAPSAASLGNPSSVGGVGGSNTASTGPGGTAATGSGNAPGTGGGGRGGTP